MEECRSCGDVLILSGCEENDFSDQCDWCRDFDDDYDWFDADYQLHELD